MKVDEKYHCFLVGIILNSQNYTYYLPCRSFEIKIISSYKGFLFFLCGIYELQRNFNLITILRSRLCFVLLRISCCNGCKRNTRLAMKNSSLIHVFIQSIFVNHFWITTSARENFEYILAKELFINDSNCLKSRKHGGKGDTFLIWPVSPFATIVTIFAIYWCL